MLRIKSLLSAAIMLLLISVSVLSADALSTGFSTEEYPQEKYDRIVSGLDVRQLTEAPRRRLIDNYDVNEDGQLAVAMPDDDSMGLTESRATVAVYDNDGGFLYGFDFNDTGMIEVEWGGDKLNVYSVRGDYIFTVDENYQVDELLYVPYDSSNNNYFNDQLQSYNKSAGGIDYVGYRGMTVDIYKVTRLDNSGGETIIYESDMGLMSPVLIAGIIIAVICIGGCFTWLVVVPVVLIVVLIKKSNKKNKAPQPPL